MYIFKFSYFNVFNKILFTVQFTSDELFCVMKFLKSRFFLSVSLRYCGTFWLCIIYRNTNLYIFVSIWVLSFFSLNSNDENKMGLCKVCNLSLKLGPPLLYTQNNHVQIWVSWWDLGIYVFSYTVLSSDFYLRFDRSTHDLCLFVKLTLIDKNTRTDYNCTLSIPYNNYKYYCLGIRNVRTRIVFRKHLDPSAIVWHWRY